MHLCSVLGPQAKEVSPAVQPPAWAKLRLFPKLTTGTSSFPTNLTIPWGAGTTTGSFRQHSQGRSHCNPYTSADPQAGSTLQDPAKLRFWFFPPKETVVLSHQFILQPVEIRATMFTLWDNKICYKAQTWKNHIFANWVQLFLRLSPTPKGCLLSSGIKLTAEAFGVCQELLTLTHRPFPNQIYWEYFSHCTWGPAGRQCVEENEQSLKSKMLAGGSVNRGDFYSVSFFHLKIKRVLSIEIHPLSLQMNLYF